jgi:hypothetical protein
MTALGSIAHDLRVAFGLPGAELVRDPVDDRQADAEIARGVSTERPARLLDDERVREIVRFVEDEVVEHECSVVGDPRDWERAPDVL